MKIKLKAAPKVVLAKKFDAKQLSQSYLGEPYEMETSYPARKGWWIDRQIMIDAATLQIPGKTPPTAGDDPMDYAGATLARVKRCLAEYEKANQPAKFAGHIHGWAVFCSADRERLFFSPSDVASIALRRCKRDDVRFCLSPARGYAICFFQKDKLVAVVQSHEVQIYDKRYFELKGVRL